MEVVRRGLVLYTFGNAIGICLRMRHDGVLRNDPQPSRIHAEL